MDDDTVVGGPEVDEDERETASGIVPASGARARRRVRIIGAEQAGSVVPPEGFAVTDDPLESDLFVEPAGSPLPGTLDDPLHDEFEGLDDPGELDLEWSPAQPRPEYESELPHWTDPPTGQVPAVLARDEPDLPEWQRAGDTGPVWREHQHDWADPGFEPAMLADEGTRVGELRTDDHAEERRPWEFADDDEGLGDERTGDESDELRQVGSGSIDPEHSGPVTTISSSVRKSAQDQSREPAGRPRRGRRRQTFGEPLPEFVAAPQSSGAQPGRTPHPFDPPSDGGSGRNMSIAIATGVAVSAVALLAMWAGPVTSLILATVVVTLCAAEAYGTLRRSGRRSATLLGLVATVGIMVTAYAKGPSAIPLMVVLLVVGTMLWYLIGVEQGSPVEGTASTVFVFVWVGVLGSFAALLLAPSQFPDRHGVAFFAGAIIAGVLNDVGALDRRPMVRPAPPRAGGEPEEDLGRTGRRVDPDDRGIRPHHRPHPPVDHVPKAALLGVVVAVVAPVGDLCESLVKRDLSLKDMGSLAARPWRDARPVRRFAVRLACDLLPGPTGALGMTPSSRVSPAGQTETWARKVALVGSTGSIGTQAVDVIRADRERFEVVALAARGSVELLAAQAQELRPRVAAVADPERASELGRLVPKGTELLDGSRRPRRNRRPDRRRRRRAERRGRVRRPRGDPRCSRCRQAAGARQQGVSDRRGPGRGDGARDARSRDRPGGLGALRPPPVPARGQRRGGRVVSCSPPAAARSGGSPPRT